MRFMAMASVVCASQLIEPKLIAPVAKRLHDARPRARPRSMPSRLVGLLELHQAADGQQPLALLVDRRWRRPCSSSTSCRAPRAAGWRRSPASRHGPRRAGGRRSRRPHRACCGRSGCRRRRRGGGAPSPRRSPCQPDALDRRGGAGEVLVDEAAMQADGVEDLRAAIGLVGRDAHLGHRPSARPCRSP